MAGKDKGGETPKKQAEVLAADAMQVKVDARDDMSYADYARQRAEPVVTVQRIIDHRAQPVPPKEKKYPNMVVKQDVIWSEPPPEPPPKPDRVAATVTSYVMDRKPVPKPPRKGIGSMEPPGRG